MRDYFNILDTPVYNFSDTFTKDGAGTMTITIGGELSRFLIYSIYCYPSGLSGADNYTVNMYLETEPSTLSRITQRLIYNETFDNNNDFIQLPNSPKDNSGSNSLVGYYPTSSNMYLVPNGDRLEIVLTNVEDGDSFNLTFKAFLRGQIPSVSVSGGSGSNAKQTKIR